MLGFKTNCKRALRLDSISGVSYKTNCCSAFSGVRDAQIGNNVRPIDPSKVVSEDLTTGDEGASCFSCALPDAPIGKMYQPSWDGWERCILTLHTLAQLVIANLGLCISVYDTESIYASFIFANEGAPTYTEFVEDERSKLQWISAWCNFS
ncbi:hypothetical protein Tco_0766578 [Tanacetum coccineum]